MKVYSRHCEDSLEGQLRIGQIFIYHRLQEVNCKFIEKTVVRREIHQVLACTDHLENYLPRFSCLGTQRPLQLDLRGLNGAHAGGRPGNHLQSYWFYSHTECKLQCHGHFYQDFKGRTERPGNVWQD